MAYMDKPQGFEPDWSTHPGEHLQEYLEVRGWKQAQLARMAGLTPKLVSDIIHAKNPVTPETALKLEKVLGLKADIWLNLQSSWDLHQARFDAAERAPETKDWLSLFPVAELKKRGWLPDTDDERTLVEIMLRFLGIGEPSGFKERFASLCVQHRRSKAFKTSEHHIACWLMMGEHQARTMDLPPFDADRFQAAVDEIRDLTCEPPETFEPRMRQLCHEAGVALVLEPEVKKTAIFGSTRWLDEHNPVIQMSLRMKSNDHFWWTFFHEAGHVSLHHGKTFVDENGDGEEKCEREANEWALDKLVGIRRFDELKAQRPRSKAQIRDFAKSINIHPGIVVGMLQHARIVPYKNMNGLKESFAWKNR